MPQNLPPRRHDIEAIEARLRAVLRECDNPEDAITAMLLFIATVFHPDNNEIVNDALRPHFDAINREALAVLNAVGRTLDLSVN